MHLTFETASSILFAEREGFEPSIPFRSIHTFQACSFDHSDISPSAFRQQDCKGKILLLLGGIKIIARQLCLLALTQVTCYLRMSPRPVIITAKAYTLCLF